MAATDDTIDTLNDLIETSKDGEFGFRSSAEYLTSAELKQLFTQRAEQCRRAAADLQTLVVQLGGTPEDGGTTAGAMHRGWVSLKGKLAGYTDVAILEETERGEDSALESYRKALESDLPRKARALVEGQLEGVRRNHAQVRSLRDQARTSAI